MAGADLCNVVLQTFCRKFQWHELMLWPEDMPPHALVCLSHNDDLVPSPMVAKHIAGELHPSMAVLPELQPLSRMTQLPIQDRVQHVLGCTRDIADDGCPP